MYGLKGSVCVYFVDVLLSLLGNDGGGGELWGKGEGGGGLGGQIQADRNPPVSTNSSLAILKRA